MSNNKNNQIPMAERWAMDSAVAFYDKDGNPTVVGDDPKKKVKKATTYKEQRGQAEEEEEKELTPADYDRWETPPGAIYAIKDTEENKNGE